MKMWRRMAGFTLVEISVALLALGLILPGAVVYWQLSERQRVSASQANVQQQARDAIVGFLHANYRLPCPAADALGVASCTEGTGLRQVGFVPWRTLGLPRPEAGALRYGIYREEDSAVEHQDRDLATIKDRMNPLRVRTPNPAPKNNDAPNPQAPPVPSVAAGLLGATQSGDPANPLNTACNAANSPPCPLGGAQSVNQIDVCLALNTASETLVASAGQLAVNMLAGRRPVAFLIAAPGLLDADGNGQNFDGANASASNSDPTFEAPGVAISNAYDDVVLAVSHAELFSELQCAGALSAASHAHFNAATGAFVLERALYDYRDQLYVSVKLAEADVAAAGAGVAGAASGVLDAAKEMLSATADTTMSVGARSFQIGLAAAGIVAAAAGGVAAGLAMADSIASLAEAQDVHSDFATRTTAMTNLAISVNRNTLTADALGF